MPFIGRIQFPLVMLEQRDTVPGVVGKSGEAALIGSWGGQPMMGSSTAKCFMPRVRQTFFPLRNHAKIGCLYGHTHQIFGWMKQSSPYLCTPPSTIRLLGLAIRMAKVFPVATLARPFFFFLICDNMSLYSGASILNIPLTSTFIVPVF